MRKGIKPCVCGEVASQKNFYGDSQTKAAISPGTGDVGVGIFLFCLLLIFCLFVEPLAAFGFIVLLPVAMIPFTDQRLFKGHKLCCACRWVGIAMFGLGR